MGMQPAAGRRQRRAVLAAMVGLLLAAGAAARAADVVYLDNQVIHVDAEQVALRSALVIRGGGQQWFRVYFRLLFDEATPLTLPADKQFLAYWGDLFPPAAPAEAEYDDLRMPLPLKDVQAATNLPRGQRSTLWAIAAVWDVARSKYVGFGWPARTALLVTTDNDGKIVKVETFNTNPWRPKANDDKAKIKVNKCVLRTRHLKLREGVRLYKATYASGVEPTSGSHFLVDGTSQADLYSAHRGYFLDRVDTPKKALEFAVMAWSSSVLVKTPKQYAAIVAALKAKGWPDKALTADPPFLGTRVTELAGLGYRVQTTLVAYDRQQYLLSNVLLLDYNVSYNGRFRRKITRLIESPPAEGPAGGQPAFPLDAEAYDRLVRSVLTDVGSQRLPEYVRVTSEVTDIPVFRGCDTKQYADPTEVAP